MEIADDIWAAVIAERNHWQDRAMRAEAQLIHIRNKSIDPAADMCGACRQLNDECECNYRER